MTTVPFSGVDALMRALDEPGRPQTVELEVAVVGRLDDKRFREAVANAAAIHPMARARQGPTKPFDANYLWTIPDTLGAEPVEISTSADREGVEAARENFYSRHIDLEVGPPFRVLLVHEPEGDRILLSVNHAAFDGVGALRLLRSISRSYAGEPDPVPDVDPLTTRGTADTRTTAGAAGMAPPSMRPPARLAPDAEQTATGFGILHLDVDVVDVTPPGDASVNDVLMAAVHLAVDAWNRSHGLPCDDVSVMMPVSQRPAEWRSEVVANLVLTGRVVSTIEDRARPQTLLAAVTAQTRKIKAKGVDGTGQLSRNSRTPVVLRKLLPRMLDVAANRFADTTVLSNLGRIDEPWWFASPCRGAWFSPPPRSPVIVAIGVATSGDRLGISIRWCRGAFTAASAQTFGDLLLTALPGLRAATE